MAAKGTLAALQALVADMQVLAFEAQEAHWNVSGVHFGPLHSLFGKLYEFALDTQDTLAERIRALGGPVRAGIEKADIPRSQLVTVTPDVMLMVLLQGLRAVIVRLRTAIELFEESDCVTANLLQDTTAQMEKKAWMVEMHTRKDK